MGKKAANVVSNSESDNEYDSLYLSLLDDKEILDCLLNLPCFSSNKKRKRKDNKQKKDNRKTLPKKKTRTLVTDNNKNHCHHSVTVEQYYLNLPEDMVEDNP